MGCRLGKFFARQELRTALTFLDRAAGGLESHGSRRIEVHEKELDARFPGRVSAEGREHTRKDWEEINKFLQGNGAATGVRRRDPYYYGPAR